MTITTLLRTAVAAVAIGLANSALAEFPTVSNDPIAQACDITGTFNLDPAHGRRFYDGEGFIAALTGTGIPGGGVVFANSSRNPFTFTLDLKEDDGTVAGLFHLIIDDGFQGKSFTGEILGSFDDFDFDDDTAFGEIIGGSEGLLDLFGGQGARFAASFNLTPTNDTDFEGFADITPAIVPTPYAISLLTLGLLGMRGARRGRQVGRPDVPIRG